MKKILVSLAVLWCVALGVQAQDNQEYEKQVAKMLEMTHTMDAMKQIFPQMTAMLKQQAVSMIRKLICLWIAIWQFFQLNQTILIQMA